MTVGLPKMAIIRFFLLGISLEPSDAKPQLLYCAV